VIYLRLAAYLAAALLFLGGGWYLGGLAPKKALAQLQAQDWQAKAQSTEVAYQAVLVELKQAQAVSANNSTIIQGLQNDNAKITASWASDRTLAQRLLNNPKAVPTLGPGLPKASSGPAVAVASGTSGDGSAASFLADASAECQRNAVRLNALSAQISPQLR